MVDLNVLLSRAHELAPLPPSTVTLIEMSANPDCHLDDIADLVEFDQALTIRLLRAANSAFSASAVPVVTVREAVARMGTQQVLDLAIAAGVRSFLQARVPAYGLDEGALWRHSVASAVSAETAKTYCPISLPPEVFTAALLHDVGKLVMGRFLGTEVLGLIRRAQEVDHLDPLAAESSVLQVNHAELGGRIAQHWRLPPRIVQGITYHHNPGQGGDPICDVTYLANLVAKQVEAGLIGKKLEVSLDPGVVARLGLGPDGFDQICPAASVRYVQVNRRYNSL
jgi:putative nucleotidyltransferase with HDIG domain